MKVLQPEIVYFFNLETPNNCKHLWGNNCIRRFACVVLISKSEVGYPRENSCLQLKATLLGKLPNLSQGLSFLCTWVSCPAFIHGSSCTVMTALLVCISSQIGVFWGQKLSCIHQCDTLYFIFSLIQIGSLHNDVWINELWKKESLSGNNRPSREL